MSVQSGGITGQCQCIAQVIQLVRTGQEGGNGRLRAVLSDGDFFIRVVIVQAVEQELQGV